MLQKILKKKGIRLTRSDFVFPFRREILTTFTNKGIKSAQSQNCIKNNETDKEKLLLF